MKQFLFETSRAFSKRGAAERVNELKISYVEKMRVLNIIEGVREYERSARNRRKNGCAGRSSRRRSKDQSFNNATQIQF